MKFRFLLLLLGVGVLARAATPTEEATALYRQKRYPEAREALEKIVAAEPNNAAACYYLGMTLRHRGDSTALDDASKWLEKAVALEPGNATYLADFGGNSMQLASKNRSFSAATRGRDAMEKSLALNPENLEARQGLWRFYAEAPWPLGSSSKAAAQLEEIRKRDPERALTLAVATKTAAKDFDGAFKLSEEVLGKNPNDFTALYQYGRTASLAGQNLTRGLECLQKCLTLHAPTSASAQPTHIWVRIGVIEEKLGHGNEARAAYETALKLDANNKTASDALAKLK